MPFRLLLISGVPATGKTAFGDWLQNEKSFLHLDIEKIQKIPDVNDLIKLSRPVVMTWGFDPQQKELQIVGGLKNLGVSLWWFTAETSIAREFFMRRGGDVRLFDYQMSRLRQESGKIEELWSPNIVETLNSAGYLPRETIYQRILETLYRSRSEQ